MGGREEKKGHGPILIAKSAGWLLSNKTRSTAELSAALLVSALSGGLEANLAQDGRIKNMRGAMHATHRTTNSAAGDRAWI